MTHFLETRILYVIMTSSLTSSDSKGVDFEVPNSLLVDQLDLTELQGVSSTSSAYLFASAKLWNILNSAVFQKGFCNSYLTAINEHQLSMEKESGIESLPGDCGPPTFKCSNCFSTASGSESRYVGSVSTSEPPLSWALFWIIPHVSIPHNESCNQL